MPITRTALTLGNSATAPSVAWENAFKASINSLLANAKDIDGSDTYGVSAVGTDAYAITVSPVPGSYQDGRIYIFKADVPNTGAATLNVNTLGAKAIKKRYNVALDDNDILAEQRVLVAYDAANDWFQMLSPVSNATGGATDTVAGVVELATPAEDKAGTATNLAVTPEGLKAATGRWLLGEQTASNSPTINFTGLDSTYDRYEIDFEGVIPATDNTFMHLRVSNNNGSSYLAGGSDYAWSMGGHTTVSSTESNAFDASDSEIQLSNFGFGSNTGESGSGRIVIHNPSNSGANKLFSLDTICKRADTDAERMVGLGIVLANTSAVDAIRFLMSSGNIASGHFKLYGVRKS